MEYSLNQSFHFSPLIVANHSINTSNKKMEALGDALLANNCLGTDKTIRHTPSIHFALPLCPAFNIKADIIEKLAKCIFNANKKGVDIAVDGQ